MSYRDTVPEAEILAYQEHLDAADDSNPCRVCGAKDDTCAIVCPWCGAAHASGKCCVDEKCANNSEGQMWIPGTRLVEEIQKLGVPAVVKDADNGYAIIYLGELDSAGESRFTIFPGSWDVENGHPFDWNCIVYEGPREDREPLEKCSPDDPDEFDDEPEDEDSAVFTMNVPAFAERVVHFFRHGNNVARD